MHFLHFYSLNGIIFFFTSPVLRHVTFLSVRCRPWPSTWWKLCCVMLSCIICLCMKVKWLWRWSNTLPAKLNLVIFLRCYQSSMVIRPWIFIGSTQSMHWTVLCPEATWQGSCILRSSDRLPQPVHTSGLLDVRIQDWCSKRLKCWIRSAFLCYICYTLTNRSLECMGLIIPSTVSIPA